MFGGRGLFVGASKDELMTSPLFNKEATRSLNICDHTCTRTLSLKSSLQQKRWPTGKVSYIAKRDPPRTE